jgi:hypothetical protein
MVGKLIQSATKLYFMKIFQFQGLLGQSGLLSEIQKQYPRGLIDARSIYYNLRRLAAS